jgi:hypothetical protein
MTIDLPPGVTLQGDVNPANWVVKRLWPWGHVSVRVGSFLPEGFDAYARILHPAARAVGDVGTVRWSTLARRSGVTIGPNTGFREVSGAGPDHSLPGGEDISPSSGMLPVTELTALIAILEYATSTADRCWFCFWDGWGHWWSESHSPLWSPDADSETIAAYRRKTEEQDRLLRPTPRVRAYARDYFLFAGPLRAVVPLFDLWEQSPSLWWPDDRAWCVATEIDGFSTYVGGSRECIDRVLGSLYLEAIEVTVAARMDSDL